MDNLYYTYEILASEYYDTTQHPTCANFRHASYILLERWLRRAIDSKGEICEVGPGKSLVLKILTQQGYKFKSIYLIDSSPSMLAYSNHGSNINTKLILGEAEVLPIPSYSIAVVVSSLGDPYNSIRFWRETYRILKEGGLALFTSPSYEWAAAYRGESNNAFTSAEFELSNGHHVRVPSLIHTVDEQTRLIESNGLIVEEVTHIPVSALDDGLLSPKLRVLQGAESSVVTGFLARKPFLLRNR